MRRVHVFVRFSAVGPIRLGGRLADNVSDTCMPKAYGHTPIDCHNIIIDMTTIKSATPMEFNLKRTLDGREVVNIL
jgi:hypothetical protein